MFIYFMAFYFYYLASPRKYLNTNYILVNEEVFSEVYHLLDYYFTVLLIIIYIVGQTR